QIGDASQDNDKPPHGRATGRRMLGKVMGVRDDATQRLVVAFGPRFRELPHPVIALKPVRLVLCVIRMQSLDELLVQRPQAVVGWWRRRWCQELSRELLAGSPRLFLRLVGPNLVARPRLALGASGD